MKELKFKTNINCGNCLATVKPFLDQEEGIRHWQVDTNDRNKVLVVQTESLAEEDVKSLVKIAGFKAENLC